jgi:competence protein ComEA
VKKFALLVAGLLAYVGLAFGAVNINTATKEELESLEGIGPVKSQAIIDYRTKNGPFKSLEDVKKVDGIGDKTFEKMKPDISTSGKTTVKAAAPKEKSETKVEPKAAEAAKPAAAPAAAPAKKEEAKAPAKKEEAKAAAPAPAPAAAPAKKEEPKAAAKEEPKAKKADE